MCSKNRVPRVAIAVLCISWEGSLIIIIIIIIIITYSLTYVLTYSLTHSLTYALTHSLRVAEPFFKS
jgi:hypothetical protein